MDHVDGLSRQKSSLTLFIHFRGQTPGYDEPRQEMRL
jgi:hypothetical protein